MDSWIAKALWIVLSQMEFDWQALIVTVFSTLIVISSKSILIGYTLSDRN